MERETPAAHRKSNRLRIYRPYLGVRIEPAAHQVTHLLQAWSEGEQGALDRLMPLVYQELQTYMARARPGHIRQTTALVNEAYLRPCSADACT